MLHDRDAPYRRFDAVPRVQPRFELELAALDRLPDDDVLSRQGKADLARRSPRSRRTDRPRRSG